MFRYRKKQILQFQSVFSNSPVLLHNHKKGGNEDEAINDYIEQHTQS